MQVLRAGTDLGRALREVDLSVRAGELVAIMGPSGSGKSTLLTIAGTLEEATEGAVFVGGANVSTMTPNARARLQRRSIGYVFQDFNLLAGLTASTPSSVSCGARTTPCLTGRSTTGSPPATGVPASSGSKPASTTPELVLARFDFAYDREVAEGAEEFGLDPSQLLAVIDANEAAVEAAGVVQHSYTAPGDGHTILEDHHFYEVEVNGVTLVDGADAALITGEPLEDVHCDQCEHRDQATTLYHARSVDLAGLLGACGASIRNSVSPRGWASRAASFDSTPPMPIPMRVGATNSGLGRGGG